MVGIGKSCDLVSVGRVSTSRRYCPFCPSNSRLRRLAPYCFNTAATPPATTPPGLCLLLITWLVDRGCVRGWLCLCVGSSCLPPLSFWGHASPPRCHSGGLGNRLRPTTHSHKCWLGYRSPSGVCTSLGFPVLYGPGTFTSRMWCHPMSLSCWLLDLFPFSKEWGSSLGYGWVDYGFGLRCISFLDGLKVFLILRVCLFTVRGFFPWVARLWRLFGSLNSGLWFPWSFYP